MGHEGEKCLWHFVRESTLETCFKEVATGSRNVTKSFPVHHIKNTRKFLVFFNILSLCRRMVRGAGVAPGPLESSSATFGSGTRLTTVASRTAVALPGRRNRLTVFHLDCVVASVRLLVLELSLFELNCFFPHWFPLGASTTIL